MSKHERRKYQDRAAKTHQLLFWTSILFTFLVSLHFRYDGANPNVSWLITMCERILNGETAYVDIFETTPPVPMLLYMPGVIIAKLINIAPETATFAFAYFCALLSLALAARILPDHIVDTGNTSWLILLPAAVVLLVFSNDVFAEREYFAAAFALPIYSVFVHHAHQGEWPPLFDRIIAALLAGLTIAIKPPLFALPGIVLAAYYWWQTRTLYFLISSGLLYACIIGLAITAASIVAFPEYLGEITTLMRDVYVPVRSHPLLVFQDNTCLAVLSCLALVMTLSFQRKAPGADSLAVVIAIGFLATYFFQGKFFSYHLFPAALFIWIAAWILIYQRCLDIGVRLSATFIGVAGLSAFGAMSIFLTIGFDDQRPTMSDLSWAEDFHRPRALAVASDMATSFPLARKIGAVWVDRIHSQWVARYTRLALQSGAFSTADKTKFQRYHNQDLEWILRTIAQQKPQIIIQDVSPHGSWLSAALMSLDPTFLNGYKIIAEEDGIRVLALADPDASRASTY